MKDMKEQSQLMLVLLNICLLLFTGSCVESDVDKQLSSGSLLSVKIPTGVVPLQATTPVETKSVPDTVRYVAPADTLQQIPTRAGETYQRAIVLQYKGGNLINSGSTDIDSYTIGSSISASLKEAEGCNIYVLVVNETTTTGGNSVFATEAGFTSAGYEFPASVSSPGDNDIPLVGSLKGVNVIRLTVGSTESGLIQGGGGDNSVKLSRIAAKLSLNLRFNISGYQVISGSGQIRNVPTKMYYVEQPNVNGVFPAEAEASAFKDVPFTLGQLVNCYIPANIRGENTGVTLPKEKYSGTAPKTTVDRCTHVSFMAEEVKNAAHCLTYSFYLGGNNTSDFNVRRNYIYTMNSEITQAAEDDKRISESGRTAEIKTDPMATAVSSSQATLHATLSTFGETPTEYGFYYKEGNVFDGGTDASKVTSTNLSSNTYTSVLSGLKVKTVYYFRAFAVCGGETVYGALSSFSTNAEGVPQLKTTKAPQSAANGQSATSSGNSVTGEGILSQGIVYSETENFDYLTTGMRVNGDPTTQSPYTVTIPNLKKGTDYWYRHYASNAQGYVYSPAEASFRTKDSPAAPTGGGVASTVADQLTFTATLPDKKNPVDDNPTVAGVRYWTADPGSNLSSGGSMIPFNAPGTLGVKTINWTGMAAGQAYWYTFYSTNLAGSECSAKQQFTASAELADPNPTTKGIGPQADNTGFAITTARKTSATLSGTGIITVTPTGSAVQSFNVTSAANKTTNARKVTITFTTTGELPLRKCTTEVTQYGVAFPASFAAVNDVPASGRSATNISVTSNITWQATSNQSWCTIDGSTVTGATHTGANTQTGSKVDFTYTVAANTGIARSATITVKGTGSFTGFSKSFTVSQKAGYQGNLKPNEQTNNNQTTEFK